MLRAFMERMEQAEAPAPAPSFEGFFEAERPRLLRAAYLLTGNAEEAEEIVQDAFIAVWERWDRVSVMASPAGYLFRVAMNRHRSAARRAIRRARRVVGLAEGGDLFAAVEERDALARAMSRLSLRRRQALVLTELLGLSSAEAGHAMGIADVTVRRLASDGRAQIRQALEEADDG